MKRRTAAEGPECVGSTVVGERGQVVIPKEVRDRMGLKPGARLLVIHHPNGPLVLLPAKKMRSMIERMTRNLEKFEE